MTIRSRIIPLLVLLTLVSACESRTFSVSLERMETETAYSFPVPATWTPSPTSLPKSTATPFPTYTSVPPLTPALPTVAGPFNGLGSQSEKGLLSPNGQWSAGFDSAGMQVVNQTSGRVWTIPCSLFKECRVVTPVKWSSDSGSLYFAPEAIIFESPIGLKSYTAVAKINVETGVWEKILEETNRYYDFAVSNDDTYLAYTQRAEQSAENKSVRLSIQNLKNGHETKYSLDGFAGGNIVWSPYTTRLVFQIQDPVRGPTSLLYYDVDLDVLKYILKEEKIDYQINTWGEDNLISLQKFNWTDRTFSDWILNPFTNEMTPVPTPN